MTFSIETNLKLLILCMVLSIINGLFGIWCWIALIICKFNPTWSAQYWGICFLITFIIGLILAVAIMNLIGITVVTVGNNVVNSLPKTTTNNVVLATHDTSKQLTTNS